MSLLINQTTEKNRLESKMFAMQRSLKTTQMKAIDYEGKAQQLEAQHIWPDHFRPRVQEPCRSRTQDIHLPPGRLMNGEHVMKVEADTWRHLLLFGVIKQLRKCGSMH